MDRIGWDRMGYDTRGRVDEMPYWVSSPGIRQMDTQTVSHYNKQTHRHTHTLTHRLHDLSLPLSVAEREVEVEELIARFIFLPFQW